MTKKRANGNRHSRYVQDIRIAATLLSGPKTKEEIASHTNDYLKALGFFKTTERRTQKRMTTIERQLEALSTRGWISEEDACYVLTQLGREEVHNRLAQLDETGATMRKLLQPQTASTIALIVHWALAALKLPAGLLSGSVGLLNDATDTFLDGLSSILVYLGLKHNKERAANVILVLLMLGTGGFTCYKAIQRLFVPCAPEVDGFTFLAAILSAIVCLGLAIYQRFVGVRSGCFALITQSIDSRNHVIVAASVTAGLIASRFKFPLLDTLVGLVVAVLILKSAVELALEILRSLGKETVDLSHYTIQLAEWYEQFRQTQVRDWMLYLVEQQAVETRTALIAQTHQALNSNSVPALQAMGITPSQSPDDALIDQNLAELFRRGWLSGQEHLTVTDAGKKHLRLFPGINYPNTRPR